MVYLHHKLETASKLNAEGPDIVEQQILKQRAEKLKRKHSPEQATTNIESMTKHTDHESASSAPDEIEGKHPKRKKSKYQSDNGNGNPGVDADRTETKRPRRKSPKHEIVHDDGGLGVGAGKMAARVPQAKQVKLTRPIGGEDPNTETKEPKGKLPKGKKAKLNKTDRTSDLDSEASLDSAFGKMDNRLLADYVAQRIRRFNADLSLVELEDKYIPEKSFTDTSTWTEVRTLANLPAFLQHFTINPENLSKLPQPNGSPHTLVITAAGLRAAGLVRILRTIPSQVPHGSIAKLFAKHIKIQVAISHCQKNRMSMGVGTPIRLIDLTNAGALSLDKLERIVIDCSHFDEKKRSILDMRDTLDPLVEFLGRPELRERYTASSNRVDLLLY